MGKNNRMRRATKQRKRQRAAPRPTPAAGSTVPPNAADEALAAVLHARYERSMSVPLAECVRPLLALPEATVDHAVDRAFGQLLRHLFVGGWTPVDLFEVCRRRAEATGSEYLLDAVAAVIADYPDQLLDPRWQAQLDEVNGQVWWDRGRPQLGQWAARHGQARDEALAMVVELLAVCCELRQLEQVLPPPGTAPRAGFTHRVDPAQEKILAKVRALLAKAESTEFDDEAEALSAKAQQLMSRYALDRALLDHVNGVRQQATLCRIWLDNPYVNAKATLVDAVARSNRCCVVLDSKWGYATVVGDESDLQAVELLTTSLLLQGTRAMLATGSQVTRSGMSRTRSYRQSFLLAYACRIGERLREANEASVSATDAGRLLPVLAERSHAVDELMEQHFPRVVQKGVSITNSAGWGAGQAAADLASLTIHGSLSDSRH